MTARRLGNLTITGILNSITITRATVIPSPCSCNRSFELVMLLAHTYQPYCNLLVNEEMILLEAIYEYYKKD